MVATTNQPAGYLPAVNQWFQSPIQGYFPGQTVAGMSPTTQNSWQEGMNAAGNVQGAGNAALGRWDTGFQMGMQGNPWLNQSIQNMEDLSYQNFNRNTLPSLGDQQQMAGGFGDTRHGIAQGIATSGLNRQLSDSRNSMLSAGYGQQLGHTAAMTSQIPGMLGAYGQTAMTPFQMMQGIGQQQQGYNQELMDEEVNRWNYNRDQPYNRLAQMGSLFGVTPIGQSTQSSGSGFNFGIS